MFRCPECGARAYVTDGTLTEYDEVTKKCIMRRYRTCAAHSYHKVATIEILAEDYRMMKNKIAELEAKIKEDTSNG